MGSVEVILTPPAFEPAFCRPPTWRRRENRIAGVASRVARVGLGVGPYSEKPYLSLQRKVKQMS